jgi:hypothetical protein
VRDATFVTGDGRYFTGCEGSQAIPARPPAKIDYRCESVWKCSVLWPGSSSFYKLLLTQGKLKT